MCVGGGEFGNWKVEVEIRRWTVDGDGEIISITQFGFMNNVYSCLQPRPPQSALINGTLHTRSSQFENKQMNNIAPHMLVYAGSVSW